MSIRCIVGIFVFMMAQAMVFSTEAVLAANGQHGATAW